MKARLSALHPLFREYGVDLVEGKWSPPVDLDKIAGSDRAGLVTMRGVGFAVHPDDDESFNAFAEQVKAELDAAATAKKPEKKSK